MCKLARPQIICAQQRSVRAMHHTRALPTAQDARTEISLCVSALNKLLIPNSVCVCVGHFPCNMYIYYKSYNWEAGATARCTNSTQLCVVASLAPSCFAGAKWGQIYAYPQFPENWMCVCTLKPLHILGLTVVQNSSFAHR